VTKLLLIVAAFGAVANGLAKAHSEPPLLIDQQPAPASLDETN
jgi:hypothetical protein